MAVLDLRKPDSLPGSATFLEADVTTDDLTEAIDVAVDRLGGLDAAVNCAGIGGESTPVSEYPLATWARVFEVNVTGILRSMQAQIPHLRECGGSIVNVSSVLGHRGAPMNAAYSAAKHAVEGLTQSAAVELAPSGVRVNTVVPGFIDTALLRSRRTTAEQGALAATHPLGRLGAADEVAEAVEFLATERSSFVTGTALRVDGGFLSA